MATAREAEEGHLQLPQWARAQGCPWHEQACKSNAQSGYLNTLEWLLASGCRWRKDAGHIAAVHGHLHVLEWMRARYYPWNDARTCKGAAIGGHLGMLQWARAVGCGWDDRASSAAAGVVPTCLNGRGVTAASGTKRRVQVLTLQGAWTYYSGCGRKVAHEI